MRICYTFTWICLMAVMACKKDDANQVIELSAEIRAFIPEHYKSTGKVIFKDSLGNEKAMQLFYKDTTQQISIGSETRTGQRIDAFLQDMSDPTYYIGISATGNTSNSDHYYQFFIAAIYTNFNQGLIPMISVREDNDARTIIYTETQSLLDKTFYQVYSNPDLSLFKGYKKLYYTKKEGVVGYADKNNYLWVLDRSE